MAHKILVKTQGPLVLVFRLRVWGQGLTIIFSLNRILVSAPVPLICVGETLLTFSSLVV